MVIFHGYERSKASTTRIELHVASETLGWPLEGEPPSGPLEGPPSKGNPQDVVHGWKISLKNWVNRIISIKYLCNIFWHFNTFCDYSLPKVFDNNHWIIHPILQVSSTPPRNFTLPVAIALPQQTMPKPCLVTAAKAYLGCCSGLGKFILYMGKPVNGKKNLSLHQFLDSKRSMLGCEVLSSEVFHEHGANSFYIDVFARLLGYWVGYCGKTCFPENWATWFVASTAVTPLVGMSRGQNPWKSHVHVHSVNTECV